MRRAPPRDERRLRPGAVSYQRTSTPGGRARASTRVMPSSGASKCRPVGRASGSIAPSRSTKRTRSSTRGRAGRRAGPAWTGFFFAPFAGLAWGFAGLGFGAGRAILAAGSGGPAHGQLEEREAIAGGDDGRGRRRRRTKAAGRRGPRR